MKYIIGIIIALVIHLGASKFSTSESSVEKYIQKFSMLSNQNAEKACELVDDNVEAELTQEAPGGTWEVAGGKDELCGFMNQGIAAMTVLQGNVNWTIENVKVQSSFPWQKAKVSYDEVSTISAAKMGSIKSTMHYDVELKRKLFGGLVVTKITGSGGTQQ